MDQSLLRSLLPGSAIALLLSCASLGGLACTTSTTNPLPSLGCTTDCNPASGQDSGGGTGPGPTGGSDSGTTPMMGTDSGGGGGGDAMVMTQSQTWTTGTQIGSPVIIDTSATVTVAPGAMVTMANGVTVTVKGTLTATSSTGTHATLTGTSWGGIIVAPGGTLTLDGVDITNASTAIQTNANDAKATYDNGTITAASTPFQVDNGSTLSTTHATVAGTLGTSHVQGSLTASHLDYDSNGHEGIVTSDPTAVLSIEDSTLHGIGPIADMVVSTTGAASIHVAYTEITNVHCCFHFDTISAFDISYSTMHNSAWGAMLYGSDLQAATLTITNSNIENNASYGLDEQGSNGNIQVTGCYFTGNGTDGLTGTNQASAPVPNAMPRP